MKTLYPYVVSACLAGEFCRYDGGSNAHPTVCELVERELALPICPEYLAGLPIPRPPCEQRQGRVVNCNGLDVTEAFQRGVELAMDLVRQYGCRRAVLKARSPSCGVGMVYDGSFRKQLIPGDGLWALQLRQAGIALGTEETLSPDAICRALGVHTW